MGAPKMLKKDFKNKIFVQRVHRPAKTHYNDGLGFSKYTRTERSAEYESVS